MMIPPGMFLNFLIFFSFFGLLRGGGGGEEEKKLAQDDKKNLSVAVDFLRTIYPMIVVYGTHLCKMMISLGFYFSFVQNFDSLGC